MTIILFGKITREDDPMYDPCQDLIRKVLPVAELPATLVRWGKLGRIITNTIER